MENKRRPSYDRRGSRVTVHGSKSNFNERRSLLDQPLRYINILEKIPIFHDLEIDQFKRILRICSKQTFSENQVVFKAEEESYQIFILIKGMLKVVFSDGKELSRISPVELVGEMGVFTGEQRSASVIAVEESIVLSIHKVELLNLFRKESELGIQVLLNVIQDISQKLRKNNAIIEGLKQLDSPEEYAVFMEKMLSEEDD